MRLDSAAKGVAEALVRGAGLLGRRSVPAEPAGWVDRLEIGERLSERERIYPLRRGSAAHLPGSDVTVDNEASETATVLEIRALDEIGFLHRITRALFDAGLDVVSARVSTLGEMVVDAFYVRESGGSKITDDSRLSEITQKIAAELGL